MSADPLTFDCPACGAAPHASCSIGNGDPGQRIHLARGKLAGMTGAEVLAWEPRRAVLPPGPWVDGYTPHVLAEALDVACDMLDNLGADPGKVAVLRRVARSAR